MKSHQVLIPDKAICLELESTYLPTISISRSQGTSKTEIRNPSHCSGSALLALLWPHRPILYSVVIARFHNAALASIMGVNAFRSCSNPSAISHLSKTFSPTPVLRTLQESPTCLQMPAAATSQAQSRFRFYSSTITTSSSSSSDAMNTDPQRAHPIEIKGQSGRQYKIERIIQDKGSLLGRVFLAAYVIPNRASMFY